MAPTTTARADLVRDLPDLAATARLARSLAARARPRDVIGLSGDLGAGKTTLARAFIEAVAASTGCPAEEVPSPTFTMVQVYEFPGLSIWHFDLYRLQAPEDAFELGLEEAFAHAVSLIEWPERLGPLLPPDRLEVRLEPGDGEGRRAVLHGFGNWAPRVAGMAADG
jgi:tRNA threonylcarbamoyladenosine biosynthesis protein TsaE